MTHYLQKQVRNGAAIEGMLPECVTAVRAVIDAGAQTATELIPQLGG